MDQRRIRKILEVIWAYSGYHLDVSAATVRLLGFT